MVAQGAETVMVTTRVSARRDSGFSRETKSMAEHDITRLIEAAGHGDSSAYGQLFTRVYAELKPLARHQLRGMRGATLDTTGLVHDAYLKMTCSDTLSLRGRRHFFALAAKAMRQIVIDHLRARAADKRGGVGVSEVTLDDAPGMAVTHVAPDRLLQLDNALADLESSSPRLSRLIEMRFFAGMPLAEIAELEGVTERTLNRDWRLARAEIYAALYL